MFKRAMEEIFDLMERDSFARFKSGPHFSSFLKKLGAYDIIAELSTTRLDVLPSPATVRRVASSAQVKSRKKTIYPHNQHIPISNPKLTTAQPWAIQSSPGQGGSPKPGRGIKTNAQDMLVRSVSQSMLTRSPSLHRLASDNDLGAHRAKHESCSRLADPVLEWLDVVYI